MPLSYSAHNGPFVLIVVTGAGGLPDLMDLIDWTAAVCRSHRSSRVLLDMLAAEIDLRLGEEEQVGEYAAHALSHVQRIAITKRADGRHAAAERAAASAGLRLSSFTDLKKATDWIGH